MSLHGPLFLFLFLPFTCLLYRAAARRPDLQHGVLVLAGLVFYAFAGLPQLALLVGMTAATFLAGRGRAAVAVVVMQLALLAAFKLAGPGVLGIVALSLPLGLSFYTFNLVSYGLDVRRGQTAPAASPLVLGAYATFFPAVSSGPLLRFGDFRQQLESRGAVDPVLLERGVLLVILGLAKKLLVADPLGAAVDAGFAGYETIGASGAWLAVLGYAYQLYFDFSGYTDLALGSAALLGFRLPPNFDAPYAALHITDFWQRWHMTMSQWFRDYLFLPLSRALLRRSEPERADSIRTTCLILTMIVIGFWHGATWSFIAWGLYHGLLLAGHARLRRVRALAVAVPVSRALTFLAVLVGWVLLRSPAPSMALRLWEAMLGLHGPGLGALAPRGAVLAFAIAGLAILTNLPAAEARLVAPAPRGLRSWLLAGLLVLSLLSMGGPSPFLYFQF